MYHILFKDCLNCPVQYPKNSSCLPLFGNDYDCVHEIAVTIDPQNSCSIFECPEPYRVHVRIINFFKLTKFGVFLDMIFNKIMLQVEQWFEGWYYLTKPETLTCERDVLQFKGSDNNKYYPMPWVWCARKFNVTSLLKCVTVIMY